MRREGFDTSYDHILRKEQAPYVFLADIPIERKCRDCGVTFMGNRLAIRCTGCRPAAARQAAARAVAKQKAKRMAARGRQ